VATSDAVIGHPVVLARLTGDAQADKLTHAMLFTGPEGVGKTTAAIALAGAIVDATDWPGGITAHPDLWLEDSDAENLSIQRVRAGGDQSPTLQDFLALRTYAGGRRVGIIARADRLTEPAADCLLKTIEEPPPRTHLILCAAHPERLPETILSRCEVVVFGPVSPGQITRWLQDSHGIGEERAAGAAALAAGCPGRALRLAAEAGALEAELDALDRFLATGGGGTAGALRTAASVASGAGAEGRERALVTLGAWASFVRDAACFALAAPELAVWSAYRPALERWAEDLPAARIVAILERILATSEAVATYAQPRLAFEALLLEVFAGPGSPPPVAARPSAAETSGGGGAAGKPRRRQSAQRGRATGGG
jgi:DNA polymerase-3 subunit delta'